MAIMGVGFLEPMFSTHLKAYPGEKLMEEVVNRYLVLGFKTEQNASCPPKVAEPVCIPAHLFQGQTILMVPHPHQHF